MSADAELTESEIFNLIFHPGFSTADKITDVSGPRRGDGRGPQAGAEAAADAST